MIKYALSCSCGHEFESWFSSSKGYDTQANDRMIACPVCTGTNVNKAVMAPSIAKRTRPTASTQPKSAGRTGRRELLANAAQIIANIKETTEHVGDDFANEARKIHFNEAPERPIWGSATREETSDLADEGISVLPLPASPKKHS